MTKHDILLKIYNEYNIPEMVLRNIEKSINDQSYQDLSQQIYLILYELPFSKLWYLYSRRQINYYIIGIIMNHRQSPYLEYNRLFKCFENELKDDIPDEIEEPEPDLYYDKLESINKILYKKYTLTNLTAFTNQDLTDWFCIELYKLYLKKKQSNKITFSKLSKELHINRNIISDSIQIAKQLIREDFQKNKLIYE